MTPPEIVGIAKDVLLSIAAVVTATVAIVGLKGWRRELKGKTEFEAARNLIKATYRLRDAVQSRRSPFISGSEFPVGREEGVASGSAEEAAQAYAHVHKNRWIPVSEALQEFSYP